MQDLRDKLDDALKATVFAGAAAAAIVAATFFICVAIFVWTEQHYGTVTASLVLAIVFLLAATAALLLNWIVHQRAKERRQQQRARQNVQWWTDPMVITAALEIYRMLGNKRLATALVGALVEGALANRSGEQRSSPNGKQQSAETFK
jgi:hypothetical protein